MKYSPYAESNDAVHAGSAQTLFKNVPLAYIYLIYHLRVGVLGPNSRKVSLTLK